MRYMRHSSTLFGGGAPLVQPMAAWSCTRSGTLPRTSMRSKKHYVAAQPLHREKSENTAAEVEDSLCRRHFTALDPFHNRRVTKLRVSAKAASDDRGWPPPTMMSASCFACIGDHFDDDHGQWPRRRTPTQNEGNTPQQLELRHHAVVSSSC